MWGAPRFRQGIGLRGTTGGAETARGRCERPLGPTISASISGVHPLGRCCLHTGGRATIEAYQQNAGRAQLRLCGCAFRHLAHRVLGVIDQGQRLLPDDLAGLRTIDDRYRTVHEDHRAAREGQLVAVESLGGF